MIWKVNLSPKSPQIGLSNDMFAERKYYQVFAYESETFHRRRPNGISHCENRENLKKHALPFARRGPHLLQQCLGPPHAPPQTAAPTVEALSHTYAVKSPLVTMARPKFAPKSTPYRGAIPKPNHLPHSWTRPTYDAKRHSDPIRRVSTMHLTDRRTHTRTDRPTDRQIVSTGKFDDYSPLRL